MKKYIKICIMIFILICSMVQGVSAEDGEIEASVCIMFGVGAGVTGGLIFTLMEVKKHKPVSKSVHADYYIKDGDSRMSVTEDKYLRSTEVKTKVSNSDDAKKK